MTSDGTTAITLAPPVRVLYRIEPAAVHGITGERTSDQLIENTLHS